ncbi:MAG TPA: hypothetical protein VFZ34_31080 [Blastocatellia bacterium]|nr:hypothetical protein [Blastocatellia bacterium]
MTPTTELEKSSLFWQDEILQVMYWMHGEGFGEQVTMPQLQKFLDAPLVTLGENVQHLLAKGLVTLASAEQYRLTEMGLREGGRRFADEFDGLLQQGHYECSDPDCDCRSGDSYAPCRTTGHSHEHAH